MKRTITSYVFNPIAGTLDFSSTPNFDIRSLYAVIHQPTGSTLYAPISGLTYRSLTGSVLALGVSTLNMNITDPLTIVYDDGIQLGKDSSLQSILAALGGNLSVTPQINGAALSATNRLPVEIDADNVTLQLPATIAQDASLQSILTQLKAVLSISATALPLPVGASTAANQATEIASLAAIASALAGTLQVASAGNAPNVVKTGSITASGANNGFIISVGQLAALGLQISGTWAGSVSFYGSQDNGATYPIALTPRIPAGGTASVVTSNTNLFFNTGAIDHVLVVATALTSGTVNLAAVSTNSARDIRVYNAPSDPMTTVSGGSIGTDASVNKVANNAAVPNVGAAFPSSSIYASYTLVSTIPAGLRNYVEVDNLSTGIILVVRDDGSAASGSAPTNASLIPLNAAPAVGQPGGGGWTSTTFKGRLQIYAPANTTPLVTAFQD